MTTKWVDQKLCPSNAQWRCVSTTFKENAGYRCSSTNSSICVGDWSHFEWKDHSNTIQFREPVKLTKKKEELKAKPPSFFTTVTSGYVWPKKTKLELYFERLVPSLQSASSVWPCYSTKAFLQRFRSFLYFWALWSGQVFEFSIETQTPSSSTHPQKPAQRLDLSNQSHHLLLINKLLAFLWHFESSKSAIAFASHRTYCLRKKYNFVCLRR